MSKERTDMVLGIEIYALCKNKPCSIDDLSGVLYKNNYAKNVVRVYRGIVTLLEYGLVVPVFKNRVLLFKAVDVKND